MCALQVVYRDPVDEEEKSTLYVQAVHADQQMNWIKDVKKGSLLLV